MPVIPTGLFYLIVDGGQWLGLGDFGFVLGLQLGEEDSGWLGVGDFVEGWVWVWVWLDGEDEFVSLFKREGNNKKCKKNEYFIE